LGETVDGYNVRISPRGGEKRTKFLTTRWRRKVGQEKKSILSGGGHQTPIDRGEVKKWSGELITMF